MHIRVYFGLAGSPGGNYTLSDYKQMLHCGTSAHVERYFTTLVMVTVAYAKLATFGKGVVFGVCFVLWIPSLCKCVCILPTDQQHS